MGTKTVSKYDGWKRANGTYNRGKAKREFALLERCVRRDKLAEYIETRRAEALTRRYGSAL